MPVSPALRHIFAEALFVDTANNLRVAPSDTSTQIRTSTISVLPSAALTRPDNTLQGYALLPNYGVWLPSEHTVEVVFRIQGNDALSLISGDSGWSVNIDATNNVLLRTGITDTPITTLNRAAKNKVAISFSADGIKVSVNSSVPTLIQSFVQNYGGFRFNHNQAHITNSLTRLELLRIRVWAYDRLESAYLFDERPLLTAMAVPFTAEALTKYREETIAPHCQSAPNYIGFTGLPSNVAAGNSVTFSVTRSATHLAETRYVRLTGDNPIAAAYPVITPLSFPIGTASVSRTFTLPAVASTEVVNNVQLALDTGVTGTVSLAAPSLPPISMLGTTKFVDGYIGGLSSLKAQGNATTTATTVAWSSFASAWYLNNSAFISLPVTHSNIRTFVLIYKEQQPVSYRGYFGNSTGYTFNGGETGSYVGTLQTVNLTYVEALNISNAFSNVKLNYTGQLAVTIDSTSNTVKVFRKVNSQWSVTPVSLPLDLQAPTSVIDASIDISTDGGIIALGFRGAAAGEGVAQVWRYIDGTWVKELHVGSPLVSPTGGFGYSVAISNDGNTLAVSEVSSASVYIFKKNVIWSPVPSTTIVGTTGQGFGEFIALSSDADVVGVSASITSVIHLYSGTGSALQQLSSYKDFRFDRETRSLVAFNRTTNSVAVFTKTVLWASTQTWSMAFTGIDIHASSTVITSGVTVTVYRTSDKAILHTFTKGSKPQYGKVISFCSNTLLTSDDSTNLELYSSATDALGSGIVSVRSQKTNKALSAPLYTTDFDIIFFTADTNMTVNRIGRTFIGQHLNGLVLGALFYNSTLTATEMSSIEDYINMRLRIGSASLL